MRFFIAEAQECFCFSAPPALRTFLMSLLRHKFWCQYQQARLPPTTVRKSMLTSLSLAQKPNHNDNEQSHH
jgi:hypothetical protein